MIPVNTRGARAPRLSKKSASITIKRVLGLILMTSLMWFILELFVINIYTNQGSATDNSKLPLDGDGASRDGNTDDSILRASEKERRGNTGVTIRNFVNHNKTAHSDEKPKLARLLSKRRREQKRPGGRPRVKISELLTPQMNLSNVKQESEKTAKGLSEERATAIQKISTTEGFHLVKAIDVTTFPRNISGVGEGGLQANTGPEEQKLVKAQWSHNYFNEYLSDKISVERSLPDNRHNECKNMSISNNLPKTSVVICFCEESWSTLLRTVHSVINRSPPELLEEIILIDDFSEREHLKEPLDKYMARFPKVKVVHLKERHGLVRARLVGVEMSMASVLTFLDSHIECMVGWLEPLLQRIHEDRRNVVCPTIDSINSKTFGMGKSGNNIGSFTWAFTFSWQGVPNHEKKRRKHPTSPIRSPAMAGGLFSIDKAFFHELGLYDRGYEIWGAENLELSFKTWMCGGQLEILPCSHVGHIFRMRQPYSFPNDNNIRTFHKNTVRMVEVWVDEPYKRVFYDKTPSLKGLDPGDLTDRKAIRQMLQCKDFQWFLDNVHPEKEMPEFTYRARGMVRNMRKKKLCLDNMGSLEIGAFACHGLGLSQLFFHTMKNTITNQDQCCNPTEDGNLKRRNCNEKLSAKYTHERGGLIIEEESGKCLELSITSKGNIVKLEECNGKDSQKWNWEHYYDDKGIEIL